MIYKLKKIIMSRSYHKSNNNKQGFVNHVCYDSNKSCKRKCHQKFRRKSKAKFFRDFINDNLENHVNFLRYREITDIWDFNSDGKRHYVRYKTGDWLRLGQWSLETIRKIKNK